MASEPDRRLLALKGDTLQANRLRFKRDRGQTLPLVTVDWR